MKDEPGTSYRVRRKEVLKNKQTKPRKMPHNFGGPCQRNTGDRLKKLPMAKL